MEENFKLFEPSIQTKDEENNQEVKNVAAKAIAVEDTELIHSDQTEEETVKKRSEAKASVT